jgi:hypothetical protein
VLRRPVGGPRRIAEAWVGGEGAGDQQSNTETDERDRRLQSRLRSSTDPSNSDCQGDYQQTGEGEVAALDPAEAPHAQEAERLMIEVEAPWGAETRSSGCGEVVFVDESAE